jgi:hypothetical protein
VGATRREKKFGLVCAHLTGLNDAAASVTHSFIRFAKGNPLSTLRLLYWVFFKPISSGLDSHSRLCDPYCHNRARLMANPNFDSAQVTGNG